MLLVPVLAPLMVPASVELHEYVVPPTVLLSAMLVALPLHNVVLDGVKVRDGTGFTVTVMEGLEPTHEPLVDVGTTTYGTVPDAELLGLVSVWLMLLPLLAEAPVMLPVIEPSVQAKVLEAVAVNEMLVPEPLHILAVVAFDTDGTGLTVKVALLEVAEGLQVPLTIH